LLEKEQRGSGMFNLVLPALNNTFLQKELRAPFSRSGCSSSTVSALGVCILFSAKHVGMYIKMFGFYFLQRH